MYEDKVDTPSGLLFGGIAMFVAGFIMLWRFLGTPSIYFNWVIACSILLFLGASAVLVFLAFWFVFHKGYEWDTPFRSKFKPHQITVQPKFGVERLKSAEEWVILGNSLLAKNKRAEALDAYRNALNLDLKNVALWKILSKTYRDIEDFNGSLQALKRAKELSPNDVEVWSELGITFGEMKDYDAAIKHFKKALSIDPRSITAWKNMGDTLFRGGNFIEAKDAYESALSLGNNAVEIWYNLGVTHIEINKQANRLHLGPDYLKYALFCFNRAHKLGDKDALTKINELQEGGISPVEPLFLAKTEQGVIEEQETREITGFVCEKCGTPLPRPPTKGFDVTCPLCRWVWRYSALGR